jgi:hypothetical protein
MLTLPNMVLAILVWYLHPPEMVPQPSLPPQMEGIPMTIPIIILTIPSTPPLTTPPLPQLGAGERRKSPQLHFPHASNPLACYVRKMDTKPTTAHLYRSYRS